MGSDPLFITASQNIVFCWNQFFSNGLRTRPRGIFSSENVVFHSMPQIFKCISFVTNHKHLVHICMIVVALKSSRICIFCPHNYARYFFFKHNSSFLANLNRSNWVSREFVPIKFYISSRPRAGTSRPRPTHQVRGVHGRRVCFPPRRYRTATGFYLIMARRFPPSINPFIS